MRAPLVALAGALCLWACTTRAPIGRPLQQALDGAVADATQAQDGTLADATLDAGAPTPPCETACVLQARAAAQACAEPGCEGAVVAEAQACLAERCPAPAQGCEAACAVEGARFALACAALPHVPGLCAAEGELRSAACLVGCAEDCASGCVAEADALAAGCGPACAGVPTAPTCEAVQCAPQDGCAAWCQAATYDRLRWCRRAGLPDCPAELGECEALGCDAQACTAQCALVGEHAFQVCVAFSGDPEGCGPDALRREVACRLGCDARPCVAGCRALAAQTFQACRATASPAACADRRNQRFLACAAAACP